MPRVVPTPQPKGGHPADLPCFTVDAAAQYIDHLPDSIEWSQKLMMLRTEAKKRCPGATEAKITALVNAAANQASSVPGFIRGPVDAVTGATEALANGVKALFSSALWVRILMVIGGLVLLFLGLNLLLTQLGAGEVVKKVVGA